MRKNIRKPHYRLHVRRCESGFEWSLIRDKPDAQGFCWWSKTQSSSGEAIRLAASDKSESFAAARAAALRMAIGELIER